jgi:hypothetical protein
MGAQPPQPKGLAPGETSAEKEESRFEAVSTILVVVAAVIGCVIAAAYLGGWLAHVLADIARSGWASK